MNRWAVPGAAVAVLATTVAVTMTGLPAQQPSATQPTLPDARLSVLCPVHTSESAVVRVAAAATGGGLRTASLEAPEDTAEASGVVVVDNPDQPQIVSGLRSTAFGAVSLIRAAEGPEQGLSAASCAPPSTEHWFAAFGMDDDTQADLELTNIDSVDATVDLTLWGGNGQISAPGSRGIVVPANSTRTVSLSVIARSSTPVSLQVVSEQGRVAATLRQRLWTKGAPRGSEWIPAATTPATDLVIPGIPDDTGTRELVITNPGERTTVVSIAALTESGRGQLPGVESVEVAPGTSKVVDITEALGEQAAALQLTADFPVTAAVKDFSPGGETRRDPAWTAAQTPLGADGLWLVPEAAKATTVLQLANPSDADLTATVTFGDQTGQTDEPVEITVPAGSISRTPVPAAETAVVRVQTGGDVLRGALLVRDELEQVNGLAVIPLTNSGSSTEAPQVSFDPRVG